MATCSCSSSSNTRKQTTSKTSSIKIITCNDPDPEPDPEDQHIIVQEGNDIPLSVKLVYGEKDDRYDIDAKEVTDLEVLVTNYLSDVVFYYVVTDSSMIDFTLYAKYLPAGKHTIKITGVWRNHEIKYTYDDVLTVLPKDPCNRFTKHVYKRGELCLNTAVFIPSVQVDVQDLQKKYSEATKEAIAEKEAAKKEYEYSKEVAEVYVEKYIPEIHEAVTKGGGGCECKEDIKFIKSEITNSTYGLSAIEKKIEEISQEPEAMTNDEIDAIIGY